VNGIAGLFDPSGVDEQDVRGPLERSGLAVDTLVYGPCVLATVVDGDGPTPSAHATDFAGSVADARIDGALEDTPAARLLRSVDPEDPAQRNPARVLMELIVRSGADALDGLAADFACATFDARNGCLTLARDAVGLRPLFLAREGKRLAFGSDEHWVIALGLVTGQLDREVIVRHIALRGGTVDRTAFRGVHRLPGGTSIRLDADGHERRDTWFRPERIPQSPRDSREALERVRAAILSAVDSRSRDRRVAVLLSGGRDSGAGHSARVSAA